MKSLRHALLTEGVKYTNRNGFKYTVLKCYNRDKYLMSSEEDYEFTAHCITLYEDGTIEWDYSTGGMFR